MPTDVSSMYALLGQALFFGGAFLFGLGFSLSWFSEIMRHRDSKDRENDSFTSDLGEAFAAFGVFLFCIGLGLLGVFYL